ncbi:MAG: NAD+ synthase [Desulfurivibrionaceae bacterium]|nr:NAD+ synthase [Desulfurivibrionaceae bacterium]
MKIALIQINPLIGSFSANCGKIIQSATKARESGCELVIFPEMAVSGYPPQDLLERHSFIEDHDLALDRLIKKISGIGVMVGAFTRNKGATGKQLHNSCILFEDGKILAITHKQLLPSYDVFDEARYFEPGTPGTSNINYRGLKITMTICEDIWNDKDHPGHRIYTTDPISEAINLSDDKIDLIVNLAASPFRLGKAELKNRIFSTISRKYRIPLLYVNQVGGQDSLLFDGGCLAFNSYGELVSTTNRFREEMVLVDSEKLRKPAKNALNPEKKDELPDLFDALVMGTRDYVRKCGFNKCVIGLSGGVDSALVAAIACAALDRENVLGVSMPSPYSSEESIEDARELAANLKIELKVIPITYVFQAQLKTLKSIMGELDHTVTEQNLQARIRGSILMAISNRFGSMLLSTGNKSEMAVGYCTLYGDMSGGLAVIADVPKLMVYSLARYLNRDAIIIPSRTIEKPPSAELAPEQTDQDDLPPYEILDPILSAWLEEDRSVAEIIKMGYDPDIVKDVVRRIKTSEYKRKQAPPGLKVTSKAFGYGRRYPSAENYREWA